MKDHFQNRLKTVYLRCGFRVYKETCQIEIKNDRRICNASIPTVLNIPTWHGPIRYAPGARSFQIQSGGRISKRTLSFPFPVSNLNTNTTFISKLRKIHRSPRIFKPGGSVSRVCTKLAQLGPVAIVAEERSKKRVWHTPPLTETIDRNSSERRTSRSLSPFTASRGKS